MSRTVPQASEILRATCLVTLVVLYFFHSVRLDSFHRFLHDDQHMVTHQAETEKDPCHRAVYHQDETSGCHHKTHVSENTTCLVCDIVKAHDHAALPGRTTSSEPERLSVFSDVVSFYQGHSPVHLNARAPPRA